MLAKVVLIVFGGLWIRAHAHSRIKGLVYLIDMDKWLKKHLQA